ncbi:MAG: acetyl-CoA carboxylase carboxyl transferase subunit beta, partial [Pseudomonadota bacterium]
MNWITDYVPPKIKSFFQRREMPENLWLKCDNCGQMLFHRDVAAALNVCTACGHHMGIAPAERFDALFDHGAWSTVDVPEPIADPLQFRDEKRYGDRLRDARRKTGAQDAMLVARGALFGLDV